MSVRNGKMFRNWNEIWSVGKRTLSTCVVVVAALSSICGLILDAPQAFKKLLGQAPAWADNPDMWWVISITIVALIVLRLIWNGNSRDSGLPRELIREKLLQNELLDSLQRIKSAARESDEQLAREIDNQLEIRLAKFVESIGGKNEKSKYLRTIRKNKVEDDPLAVVRTAVSYIQGFLGARFDEFVEKQLSCPPLNAKDQPTKQRVSKDSSLIYMGALTAVAIATLLIARTLDSEVKKSTPGREQLVAAYHLVEKSTLYQKQFAESLAEFNDKVRSGELSSSEIENEQEKLTNKATELLDLTFPSVIESYLGSVARDEYVSRIEQMRRLNTTSDDLQIIVLAGWVIQGIAIRDYTERETALSGQR